MRLTSKFVLAGAAIAAIGFAGAVAAQNFHVITLSLPGGGTEQIRYFGETPPQVRVEPGALVAFSPTVDPFGPASVFAAMDRVSAQMDRQVAQMLGEARLDSGPGNGTLTVNLGALPPGVTGYSVVSTLSGGQVCTQRTEYAAARDGRPPKVLTSTSGDCAATRATPGAPSTVTALTPEPSPRPSLLRQVSY